MTRKTLLFNAVLAFGTITIAAASMYILVHWPLPIIAACALWIAGLMTVR